MKHNYGLLYPSKKKKLWSPIIVVGPIFFFFLQKQNDIHS